MRAIVIREPGGPAVLELREIPAPSVYPGTVKISVALAGVNRADLLQRAGFYPAPPGAPRDVPGLEYVGRVVELGAGVTRHAVGDRVYGLLGGGGYADEVVVHEREAVKVPDHIDDPLAGATPEIFVTAYDALVVRGQLAQGETVLVHAAGSGVGTAGITIADALGCPVIGTSRTGDKLTRCRELGLGLGHGIVPNVTKEGPSFAKEVLDATGGRGVDVVLDLVGGAYTAESLRCLAPKGRIVVVGLTGGRETSLELGLLLQKRATIVGTVLRSRPIEEKILAAQLLGGPIGALLGKQGRKPVLDRIFPLADAGDAHRYVASDASFGKVLLDLRATS